jgi:Bacterial SH3 domain
MINRKHAFVLAAALLLGPFMGIVSADGCIVADPTGTPLNVRKRPSQHAPIIGALNNGTAVQTEMSQGDWVHIVPHEAPGKSWWVWRKFLDCHDKPLVAAPTYPTEYQPGEFYLLPRHKLMCNVENNGQGGEDCTKEEWHSYVVRLWANRKIGALSSIGGAT